jgi:hypothetical protein
MLTFEPCETWHWMQFGRLTPAELFRFERWRYVKAASPEFVL